MKYRLRKDAVYSKIDEEVVIMSLNSDSYISLNEVGTRIWELLTKGPKESSQIVKTLTEEYEVDEETCYREVESFLAELEGKGLVDRLS